MENKKQVSEELIEKITALQKEYMDNDLKQWENGEKPTQKKESLDDVLQKSKEQYDYKENNVL